MIFSVIIPTHQRRQQALFLVRQLLQQKFAESEFEILVISNFLDQKLANEIQILSCKHLVSLQCYYVGRKGVNRARNMGLKQAQGQFALFLDDDCVLPDAEFLQRYYQTWLTHPRATGLGGGYDSEPGAPLLARVYNEICRDWLQQSQFSSHETSNLVGGNFSIRLERLRFSQIQFNEKIIFGGAETDLIDRLLAEGHLFIFDSQLNLFHRPSLHIWSFLLKAYKQGRAAGLRRRQGLEFYCQLHSSFIVDRGAINKHNWYDLFFIYIFKLVFKIGFNWQANRKSFLKRQISLIRQGWRHQNHCKYRPNQGTSHDVLRGEHLSSDDIKALLPSLHLLGFRRISLSIDNKVDAELMHELRDNHIKPVFKININSLENHIGEIQGEYEYELLIEVDHKPKPKNLMLFQKLTSARPDSVYTLFYVQPKSKGRYWSSKLMERAVYIEPHQQFASNASGVHRFLTQCAKLRDRYGEPLHFHGRFGAQLSTAMLQALKSIPIEVFTSSCWSSGKAKISVVIPVYNGERYLTRVLDHLVGQSMPHIFFEVIVVDDGSSDRTLTTVTQWHKQVVIENPDFQLKVLHWPRNEAAVFRAGMARNWGVAWARGKKLLFLDADIILPCDYLYQVLCELDHADLVQAPRRMLTQAASQGAIVVDKISAEDIYSEDTYWENFKSVAQWGDLYHFWKYTCTYALALHRKDFESVGGFAGDFSQYGFEDVHLGYRLWQSVKSFKKLHIDVYHLYPQQDEHNYHQDVSKRMQTLANSCRTFYFLNPAADIYMDFYWLLNPVVFNWHKTRWGLIHRLYWRLRSLLQRLPNEIYWRHMHSMLAKPFYVVRYQISKFR